MCLHRWLCLEQEQKVLSSRKHQPADNAGRLMFSGESLLGEYCCNDESFLPSAPGKGAFETAQPVPDNPQPQEVELSAPQKIREQSSLSQNFRSNEFGLSEIFGDVSA